MSQTRKKCKQRILEALDEIRDLVERCCSDESLSTNSQSTYESSVNSTKSSDAVCPGGPATWNQFQKMYMETHADELKGIPYEDVQKIISKAYRSTECGATIEDKIKSRRGNTVVSNNNSPPKFNNNQRQTRTRTVRTMPGITQNVTTPYYIQSQSRKFNLGNTFTTRMNSLQNHTQNVSKKLENMERNYPDLAGNINAIKSMLTQQKSFLQNVNTAYKNDKDSNFSPTSYNIYKNNYEQTLQQLNEQKTKINEGLQTLKTKANTTRKVRLQVPNNSQIKYPGQNTLQSNLQNNLPTTTMNPSTAKVQTMFSNLQIPNTLQLNNNQSSNNTRGKKVKINGKKYFYWENEEGKHLRDRNNQNNPGNQIGFYNETAPGYFRPE